MSEGTINREIFRLSEAGFETVDDYLVEEYPLTIFLAGEELVTLLCTPKDLKELAIGFLHGEGFIKGREDIISWRLEKEKGLVEVEIREPDSIAKKLYRKRIIPTGCGKGNVFFSAIDALECKKIASDVIIKEDAIYRLLKQILHSSQIFQMTGAVHTVALCNPEEILALAEDVARHNAVDKLVGYCLLNNISPKDKVIISTGRISSEMLSKVAKLEIPILISKSAPTSLAVEMAEKLGITLVGFVRGRRMNVYSHHQRIIK